MADAATDVPEDANPLLVSAPPVADSVDRQIYHIVKGQGNIYFDQWKRKYGTSTPTRLRAALAQLLPALIAARDYAGAARVLSVMYHRFTVTPALCIEASLEIIRRKPDYRDDLLRFYEAALQEHRLDKMLLMKELLLFHIIHGEFYEAYHLFQDKIQKMEGHEHDARLLSNFGMLCYWLLFIESKEMRDMLKREDLDDEEDEDEEMEGDDDRLLQSTESIESVIETNYLFKPPIGVHILYQHASGALRRAVALCPGSAVFVEYYAQLLVLVGDIQSACDYMEDFFHSHPDDPHGARMLSGFLEKYYPDSVDAQVAVYLRWIKADPTSRYALEKVLELSSAGAISSYVLTKALVEALDSCGSDMYITENPQLAITLWRNLAELLTNMDDDEFLSAQSNEESQETIADIGAQHVWWKRVYFSRPRTAEEVISMAHTNEALVEVSVCRAAVANRFFPGCLTMPAVLFSAATLDGSVLNRDHIRLLKSFFPSPPTPVRAVTAVQTPPRSLIDMRFMNVIVRGDDYKPVCPEYQGASTFHVIKRSSIVKRVPASEEPRVEVTREGNDKEVDPKLIEDLYEALKGELLDRSSSDRDRKKARNAPASPKRAIVPAYVAMVEEEAYSYPDATPRHIYTMVSEKLALSDMVIPTFKQVIRLIRFLRIRWEGNLFQHGHRGLLLRYEAFLAGYVLKQRQRGQFEVTNDVVKAAIEEMKRVFPSTHPHFPDERLVELVMCSKMSSLARTRRVRLAEVRSAIKPILKQYVYVNEKELVAAVWSVCKDGGLDGILSVDDIKITLESLLPGHYYWVIAGIRPTYQMALARPEIRGTSNDPVKIQRNFGHLVQARITIEKIQAVMWMERYEAVHGRLIEDDSDFWESTRKRKREAEQEEQEEEYLGGYPDIIVLDEDGNRTNGVLSKDVGEEEKEEEKEEERDATAVDGNEAVNTVDGNEEQNEENGVAAVVNSNGERNEGDAIIMNGNEEQKEEEGGAVTVNGNKRQKRDNNGVVLGNNDVKVEDRTIVGADSTTEKSGDEDDVIVVDADGNEETKEEENPREDEEANENEATRNESDGDGSDTEEESGDSSESESEDPADDSDFTISDSELDESGVDESEIEL